MIEGLQLMGVLPVLVGCSYSLHSIRTNQFKLNQCWVLVKFFFSHSHLKYLITINWAFAIGIICFQFGLIVEYRWTISFENGGKSLLFNKKFQSSLVLVKKMINQTNWRVYFPITMQENPTTGSWKISYTVAPGYNKVSWHRKRCSL